MAGTTLGTVYVILKGNNTHLIASLKKSKSAVKTFSTSVKRSMRGMSASVTNIINRSFNQIFHFIKRVAEVAIIAFAAMSYAIVKFASDAKESENLYTQSMRGMADVTRKWSEDLSKALFLNAFEVRRNVGLFNVMLKSMGATSEQAQFMAQNFTRLAYDMASFYNISDEQAFGALKSGITGLVKPLKALGILINVEILEEYVKTHKDFADQIGYNGKKLTMFQKVLVRNNVIFIAARASMGDLARTQKDWMQITRAIGQQLKLLGISLGQVVLPALEKYGIKIRDYIIKDKDKIVAYFAIFIDKLKEFKNAWDFSPVINGIKDAINKVWNAFLDLNFSSKKFIDNWEKTEDILRGLIQVFTKFWKIIAKLIGFIGGLEAKLADLFYWFSKDAAGAEKFSTSIIALVLVLTYLRVQWWALLGIAIKYIAVQIKNIALTILQATGVISLVGTYGLLAGSMIAVSAAATTMWAAITGPVGWVIAAIALAVAGLTVLVSKTAAGKLAGIGGGKFFGKGGKAQLNKDEKENLASNEAKLVTIKAEKEMNKKLEVQMKKFKKMQDDMTKEMKSRIQKQIGDMRIGSSEEDKIRQEQLEKEKEANKEKLSDYKRTLKKMRDAQNEVVRVLGPRDIAFSASRRQAERISGVGIKTVERERNIVKAIEHLEKTLDNTIKKTNEDVTY